MQRILCKLFVAIPGQTARATPSQARRPPSASSRPTRREFSVACPKAGSPPWRRAISAPRRGPPAQSAGLAPRARRRFPPSEAPSVSDGPPPARRGTRCPRERWRKGRSATKKAGRDGRRPGAPGELPQRARLVRGGQRTPRHQAASTASSANAAAGRRRRTTAARTDAGSADSAPWARRRTAAARAAAASHTTASTPRNPIQTGSRDRARAGRQPAQGPSLPLPGSAGTAYSVPARGCFLVPRRRSNSPHGPLSSPVRSSLSDSLSQLRGHLALTSARRHAHADPVPTGSRGDPGGGRARDSPRPPQSRPARVRGAEPARDRVVQVQAWSAEVPGRRLAV